ncbi:MAG: glycosyltransferase family 1 protein, partial [Bacteriovoracaceae bacterium]|nr:glycosyltransferase family 1 protein [Bacteriovoracaceae bacterium]
NYNGGFQLTDFSAGLEDYYLVGKEITCYRDIDEATTLIKYYLENDEERERIKEAGFKRALNEHTYHHRFKDILERIERER